MYTFYGPFGQSPPTTQELGKDEEQTEANLPTNHESARNINIDLI